MTPDPSLDAHAQLYRDKYIGARNSTGILCGKKGLVEAAYQQSFIGFEIRDLETVGRPLKLDRHEVVAVAVALPEWLSINHEARIAVR